jgi:hypothetical protein
MAWRSGDRTLKAYEHVQRNDSFLRHLGVIHAAMRRRRQRPGQDGVVLSPMMEGKPSLDPDLAYLLGEDQ